MFVLESVILLTAIGYLVYKFFTRNFDYWKKRNVPYEKPIVFFGNYYEIVTFRTTIAQYLAKLYNKFKTPYFGMFMLNKPTLVIRDKELIKAILVKDFDYFCDRNILADAKCDSLFSKFLFSVKNPDWKLIRTKMTPVFTPARIKRMLRLVNGVSLEMTDYIKKHSSKPSIETKDLCARYATDVIATCTLGINPRSFESEKAEFRAIGRLAFDTDWGTAFRQVSYFMVPQFAKLLKLPFFKSCVSEFLRDVFWKTIQLREETNSKRNDLIDILIQMKNQSIPNIDFTGDKVVAQAALFFLAGSETPSAAMAFTLYELCLAPKIQHRARLEIREVLEKHGDLTYEAVKDLKYLHMILSETLRKYPVLPFLDRLCVQDYQLPGSNLVIEKGTSVFIPMFGIHYDPEIYPEPEKFNPERFSEETRNSLPNCSFLPFGEGPRNCIGKRFALLFSKLGLARILLEYELEKSSDKPLEFETKSLAIAARNGLPVKFKKIVSDGA